MLKYDLLINGIRYILAKASIEWVKVIPNPKKAGKMQYLPVNKQEMETILNHLKNNI